MARRMRCIPLVFLAVLAGCATARWTQVGGEYRNEPLNFLVDLPQGWMRVTAGEALVATRDGVALQDIRISRHGIDKPLPNTKKNFRKGMTPLEVAEVALDQFGSNPDFGNMNILENRPETIGEQPGFRSVFTYRSKSGVKYKEILCGFLLEDQFYILRYSAAQRLYYDRDVETFEKVVRSFRLIKPPGGPAGKPATGG